jgi:hypothetical protein
MNGFDTVGLEGWGSIRSKLQAPFKRALGKKGYRWAARYLPVAGAAVLTVASGGTAAPVLAAAAAEAAMKTKADHAAKRAARDAERDAAGLMPLTDLQAAGIDWNREPLPSSSFDQRLLLIPLGVAGLLLAFHLARRK